MIKPIRTNQLNSQKDLNFNPNMVDQIGIFRKKIIEKNFLRQIKKIIKDLNEPGLEIISIFHLAGEVCSYKSSYKNEKINFCENYNQKLFNNLFTSIRKNRKNDFGKTKLSLQDFDFIGTYQTEAFHYNKIRCIVLIGRNEFLPFNLNIDKSEIIELISALSLSYFLKFKELHNQLSFLKIKTISHEVQQENSCHQKITPKSFFHKQRIQLLGELLNTLKHELSNPLFGINLGIDILKNLNWSEAETLNDLEIMGENALKCSDLIDSFCSIYTESISKENSNLIEICKRTLMLLKSELKKLNFEFIFTKDEDHKIFQTVPNFISQIIFNLILNSVHAIKSINKPSPHIRLSIKREHEHFNILIEDNGPGVGQEQLKNLFEPFHTTKKDGNGLGLSISKFLAQKVSGSLNYLGKNSGYTCFKIDIPIKPITNESECHD